VRIDTLIDENDVDFAGAACSVTSIDRFKA
jgi:hypothetical protein